MKLLLITALELEFQAVLSHIEAPKAVFHPSGTVYEQGRFFARQSAIDSLVCQMGAGNPSAALETERAITFFNPTHVLLIGVAGGLKDVALGDVVAGTKIYGFEGGKEGGDFRPRPEVGQSSYEMVQHAKRVSRTNAWLQRRVSGSSDPRSFVGPIAAGEKVVASKQSSTYARLKQNYGDALAVEMEGFGATLAAAASPGVQILVVRGISDLIDGKAAADAQGSQTAAADNAAAFGFEVVSSLLERSNSEDTAKDPWEQLEQAAIQLYPRGPEEHSVWERAGGDLSVLTLTSSARGTWHNALKALKLGGGGKQLSAVKLLEEMIADYPANPVLLALKNSSSRL